MPIFEFRCLFSLSGFRRARVAVVTHPCRRIAYYTVSEYIVSSYSPNIRSTSHTVFRLLCPLFLTLNSYFLLLLSLSGCLLAHFSSFLVSFSPHLHYEFSFPFSYPQTPLPTMTNCTTDWSNVTLATFNQTLLNDTSLCTKCTCPLVLDGEQLSWVRYYPNLAGNVLYAVLFGLFLVLQLFFGISRKTRGYMIGMTLGLILEVLGYVGRILLRYSMFEFSWFLMCDSL